MVTTGRTLNTDDEEHVSVNGRNNDQIFFSRQEQRSAPHQDIIRKLILKVWHWEEPTTHWDVYVYFSTIRHIFVTQTHTHRHTHTHTDTHTHRHTHTDTHSVRFAVGWSDLEAVAAVLTLDGHDRTVVQIQDHPACHRAPRLTHQITALREEEQAVPRRRHQTRLTAGHRDFSMLNQTRHLPAFIKPTDIHWSVLPDVEVTGFSGWGRDSRGPDHDPACRRCRPRTGALSETSAWPLLPPLTETQYCPTDRHSSQSQPINDQSQKSGRSFTSDSC